MKYRENIIEQLKVLPHFNKTTINQLAESYKLKDRTVDAYISRSLKYKDLISLKKGTYVTKDFYEKHKSDISYTFYIANILRKPSYISSWTALQYYNLATEAIHGVISVTPKRTREHITKLGNFSYRSIKEGLFSDFSLGKGEFTFFIASPSKALFDLLYFKTNELRSIRHDQVLEYIKELRIDFDDMEKKEQKHFWTLLEKYKVK